MIAESIDVGPASCQHATDVVIVGAGAAGLSAALRLAAAGRRVELVTKSKLGAGSSAWAQGGMAAVISRDDSRGAHVRDTLIAGAGLCDPDAVGELAQAAPQTIQRLTVLGARFDRAPGAGLALGLEGGHRARRIVHAGGDATGAEIIRVLKAAVARAAQHGKLEMHEKSLVVDALSTVDGAVCGVRLIDGRGLVCDIHASAVILATGGIGQAWPLTTNPAEATGDGLAIALRAGALIRDIEFVQFHPTALATSAPIRRQGGGSPLISEALRGEGAQLVTVGGAPIMTGVHPLGDLAPRDVVASAIHMAMAATGAEHVLLDATSFSTRTWTERFPNVLALCKTNGIDPRTQPIPVAPAEHYSCGGVLARLDGTTSVPGLYAIGEVASTGVHGANRLASNSLTEALTAASRVAQLIANQSVRDREPVQRDSARPLLARVRSSVVDATAVGSGLLRDEEGLERQLAILATLSKSTEDAGMQDAAANALRAAVEATNLHAVSTAVAKAGLNRTESRGCHRRADFPHTDREWERHQVLRLLDGEVRSIEPSQAVAA